MSQLPTPPPTPPARAVIDLDCPEFPGVYLIFPGATGVVYLRTIGGVFRRRRWLEGALIRLDELPACPWSGLFVITTNYLDLPPYLHAAANQAIHDAGLMADLRPPQERESLGECWLPVRLGPGDSPVAGRPAILTWPVRRPQEPDQ